MRVSSHQFSTWPLRMRKSKKAGNQYGIMATLGRLPGIAQIISKKIVEERKSYENISTDLKASYPNLRGLSSRSVRRYCETHGIHQSSRLSNRQLDMVIRSSVAQVSFAHTC